MAMIIHCLLSAALLSYCMGYKVLVVFPFTAKSHDILGSGVVNSLLDAGHEVTYITHFPATKTHPNLRQIDISVKSLAKDDHGMNIEALLEKKVHRQDHYQFTLARNKMDIAAFKHENFQKLLDDPSQQFDVVVAEWLNSNFFNALGVLFKCPLIWLFPFEPNWTILSIIDEAPNSAYTPHALSTNIAPFTFSQRLEELWTQMKQRTFLLRKEYSENSDANLYESMYGPILAKKGIPMAPYDEVKNNASLVLGNSHVSLGYPNSLPQSFKPIGGYHIDPNVKPLPENLQRIMDDSKEGVIYFSMGSIMKSKDMPEELKTGLLNMFGELNQTVFWKFEDAVTNLPSNVYTLQWAPQLSILAHPNCRLFITHGGMLSTTEALHFGVPIIGIPVFGDQYSNVNRAVHKGFGKKVDLSYSMTNDLRLAITDIINNPSYREKARDLSIIYHDRPVPPRKELTHWVEHVIRTRGALHFRSPALDLDWYQKSYLDLVAIILITLITIIFIVKKVVKKLSHKSTTKTTQSNGKKYN